MLSEMKYLNISTEMARISIHQEQPHSIKNTFRPAELHRNYDPPLADVAATQVDVDIDTYNARKAYGFLNNEDLTQSMRKAASEKIMELVKNYVVKETGVGTTLYKEYLAATEEAVKLVTKKK